MRSYLQKYKSYVCIGLLCLPLLLSVIFGAARSRAAFIIKADSEGNITWENEPTMATSGTKWETQGFLIYASKTKDGDPLSSGKPYARIELDNRYVRSITAYDENRGKYITRNTIDAEYVMNAITGNPALYEEFMANAGQGKPYIYLNAFFRTYRVDAEGNRTILAENLCSRSEIAGNQNWVNRHEWDSGRGYYNVEVSYRVLSEKTQGSMMITGVFTEANPSAYIASTEFDVESGIPGSEKVYTVCECPRYLLGYRFENVSGTAYYTVYGQIVWKLSWTEKKDGRDVVRKRTETRTYPVTVERRYSYWKINNLEVYSPESVSISNGAMERTSVIYGNPAPESLVFCELTDADSHVVPPAECEEVIMLGEADYKGKEPPAVDMSSVLDGIVGQCTVRNDSLVIDGVTVMDGAEYLSNAPVPLQPSTVTPGVTLSERGIAIPAERANGTYRSEGLLTYKRVAGVNSANAEHLVYTIEGINPVTIHTPVVCSAFIDDARRYCELIGSDLQGAQLVLDRYFSAGISLYGTHRDIRGYGNRNYGRYCASSEVMFPFDVVSGGVTIKAGTWHFLGNREQFYIPKYVHEGDYTVLFRSIALNAYSCNGLLKTESRANLSTENYVALDMFPVHVSGRLFDLKITGVNDWNTNKPVGTLNENGDTKVAEMADTAPLVPGDQLAGYNDGILKRGYRFDFAVTTIGDYENERNGIVVRPSYYVLGRDGSSRIPVDVYRTDTAASAPFFLTRDNAAVYDNGDVMVWTGSFGVPQDIRVVPKGFDINIFARGTGVFDFTEPFFIRKGYLLVCFDVRSIRNGAESLSLTDGPCNMWRLQGGIKDRVDKYGNEFAFMEGDFVLYDLEKCLDDDYNAVAVY